MGLDISHCPGEHIDYHDEPAVNCPSLSFDHPHFISPLLYFDSMIPSVWPLTSTSVLSVPHFWLICLAKPWPWFVTLLCACTWTSWMFLEKHADWFPLLLLSWTRTRVPKNARELNECALLLTIMSNYVHFFFPSFLCWPLPFIHSFKKL